MALSVGSGETGLEGAWAAAYYIGLIFSILSIRM